MPATEVLSEQTNEVHQQNVINSEEKITRVAELTVYADKATIISNNPNEMNNVVATVPSSVPEQKTAEQTHHTVINNTTTIDINPVISEKPVVTPKNELTKNAIETTSKKVAEKPVVKQVAKKEVSKPVSKPKKVTSTKTTTSTTTTAKVTKTPAKPKVVQYWVQVTSLKSKKSAENAREVLDENKITADIFTYKDKKDQLFYRVRVGPYTTKSEAEYWQSKIAKIDTFASSSSYITSTTLD
jgi:cell division septation protein DedD